MTDDNNRKVRRVVVTRGMFLRASRLVFLPGGYISKQYTHFSLQHNSSAWSIIDQL